MPEILSRKYDGPRNIRPWEAGSLLKLLDSAFFDATGGIRREFPHLYGDIGRNTERFHVITRDGEVVSHVGLFPLTFVSPRGRVSAGGIGGVVTRERFRGKGLMSALLLHVMARMKGMGLPMSILWGDRERYARYGWEPAGRRLSYGMGRRSLKSLAEYDEPVSPLGRPWESAAELHALFSRFPYRVERTRDMFALMMHRKGRTAFVARAGRRLSAYALARRYDRRRKGLHRSWRIEECGGSTRGILSIMRFLLAGPAVDELHGLWPLVHEALPGRMLDAVDGWLSQIEYIGQIKLMDASAVLRGLGSPRLAPAVSGMKLEPKAGVRLLFGPPGPDQLLPPRLAARVPGRELPLDFFMWQSDSV